MITRRGFAGGVLLGAAVMGLVGCGSGEGAPGDREVEELRYRLTVEVNTPEGLKSGSSVIEVRAVKNPDWLTPEGRGHRYSFKGEAVAVDLPAGRTLFALVSGQGDASEYPWFAFGDRLATTRDPLEQMQMMRGWMGTPKGSVVMPPTGTIGSSENGKAAPSTFPNYPMLVTFGDIADPKSVERVEPDALDKAFGAGVKLKAISVTVTDDKVTTGIEKRLGQNFWSSWVRIHQEEMKRPGGVMKNPYFKSLQGQLSRNDFITENTK